MPADGRTRSDLDLIAAANRERAQRGMAARPPGEGEAESRLSSRYRTQERLAIYGSLAPGRVNHHIVAPLGGTYEPGVVEGDLTPQGWATALGFPALSLRVGGPAVPVVVLTAPGLPEAWADLDAFEGPGYRRVLVPVWSAAEPGSRVLLTVANIYEAAF